jgi:uncharacterized protein YegP (UPF0339 family)
MAKEPTTEKREPGPFFELRQQDKEWNWMLWASNGRAIATNLEPYNQQNDAARSIERLKEFVKTAPVLVTR